jgi:hypothetical protein
MIQLHEFNKMATDADQRGIIEVVFGDVNSCIRGAYERLEWLALNALCLGSITLSKTNNDGIVTEEAIDYQMAASHKRCIANSNANREWDYVATSTTTVKPITDIRELVAAAKANGHLIQYLVMGDTDFGYMQLADETKQLTFAYQGIQPGATATYAPLPNLEQINMGLKAQGLPTIIVVDKFIDIEAANTITATDPWTTGYIAALPALNVGDMMSGPIMEEDYPAEHVRYTKYDGRILVGVWAENNPVRAFTQSQTVAFPSLPDIDRMYRLNVDKSETDGLDN